MSSRNHTQRHRRAVLGCCLFALLAAHLLLRYLTSSLFGFAEYRGLSPVVPFLVLGGYSLGLLALAVVATARRLKSGGVLGLGLLTLAVEPFLSSFWWGDGCEVGGSADATLLPEVTVDGVGVIVYTWNGACTASLNTVHIGAGILLVGGGLWVGNIPERILTRWVAFLETAGVSYRST